MNTSDEWEQLEERAINLQKTADDLSVKNSVVNRYVARNTIKDTLKKYTRTPSVFEIPKILEFKSRLESCISVGDAIMLLEDNRESILKISGISDTDFNECIMKLNTLR